MQPDKRDAALLWDMVEAARRALEFAQDKTFDEYLIHPMVQYAVERAIEIIGEAANRISPQLQEAHPEIPWRQMVGQRNVLIHEYGDIDHSLVWSVVQKHLPLLISQIEPLLPPPPVD